MKQANINNFSIQQNIFENLDAKTRIMNNNRKHMTVQSLQHKNKKVTKKIIFKLPQVNSIKITINDSLRVVPKPPHKREQRPIFSYYHRNFRYIYFLIAEKQSEISKKFQEAYQQLVVSQHRPLKNLVYFTTSEQIKNSLTNLQSFVSNNMQIKMIIQSDPKYVEKYQKQLNQIFKNQEIIEIVVPRKKYPFLKAKNLKEVHNISQVFDSYIKRAIKKSTNDKTVIHPNFVDIQSSSSEVFNRKNLIQKCLQPKSREQCLIIHKSFKDMIKNHQNTKLLNEIDSFLDATSITTYGTSITSQRIKKCKDKIQQIQKQQAQFCNKFQKYLQNQQLIQYQSNCYQVYMLLIQQYKQQHSIYEIINNNIRLSISVTQNKIKQLAVIIKYLYQAIQYFFEKYKLEYQFDKLYRGCLISEEEIGNLRVGSLVRNIGFFSTSTQKKMAQQFKKQGCKQAYLLIIELGSFFKQSQCRQDGFIFIKHLYQQYEIKQKLEEYQVLMNPLNVFEIKEINQTQKQITLIYAPHIVLFNKIKQLSSNPQRNQQKIKCETRYKDMIARIANLETSQFDKGKSLFIKGQTKQALQYYEEAEKSGSVLTVSQKLNRVEIMTDNGQLDEAGKYLQKIINQSKKNLQEIKQADNITSRVQKAQKIMHLSRQSLYLQDMNKSFYLAETAVNLASTQSQNLSNQVQNSKGILQDSQLIQMLIADLHCAVSVGKCNNQANSIKQSLSDCYTGFLLIDKLYSIYKQYYLPKLTSLIKKVSQQIKQRYIQKCQNLFKKCIQFNQKQKQINNKELLKSSKRNKQIFKYNSNNQIQQQLTNYFNQRTKTSKLLDPLFKQFYKAALEVTHITTKSKQLRLMQDYLYQIDINQNINVLMQSQKQLYQITKRNLRQINFDPIPCYNDQKQNYYSRFDKFNDMTKLQQELKANFDKNIIDECNQYASFLFAYGNIHPDSQKSKQYKQQSEKILQQLNNIIQKHQKSLNKGNSQVISLTNQKTSIITSGLQEQKNSVIQQQILQKYSTINSIHSDKSANKMFISVSGENKRKDFDSLKQKYEKLEKIHLQDNQINKFYFLLKDTNDQVQILNNSYSICSHKKQYLQFLNQAKIKVDKFKQHYIKKIENIIQSEVLISFYYLQAKNCLSRGYFKQAKQKLQEIQVKISNIYKNPNDKISLQKINKLYARELPIKCYKLKAGLVGIYSGQQQRVQLLKQLQNLKNFISQKAPDKPKSQASLSEAISFLAIRCIPKKMSENKKSQIISLHKILQCIQKSCQESIKIRQVSLGPENQFTLKAHLHLLQAYSHNLNQKKNKFDNSYIKAQQVFDVFNKRINPQKPETYLDRDPILYLDKLQMQINYNRALKINKGIVDIYKQNLDGFEKNRKGLHSLYIAQVFYDASQELLTVDLPLSQNYLKKCEQEVKIIQQSNNSNLFQQSFSKMLKQIKQNVYKSFVSLYKKTNDPQKRKKYQKKLLNIDKPNTAIRIKKQQQNFINFSFDYILKCIGMN